MERLLFLLLLSSLAAPQSYGFSQPSLFHRGHIATPPSWVVPRVVQRVTTTATSSSRLHSTAPTLKDVKEAPSITDIADLVDNDKKNIDVVRRNRSLTRRDRLARWRAAVADADKKEMDQQDNYFLLAAFLPALLAFLTWKDVSFGLSSFLDTYGAIKGADGGQFANNLLRPTITGVVVPVISIALATLVSTTVNVLRQRQVDLRALVNKEACELRLLRGAVFGMFGTRQHASRRARALALLSGYAEELMMECHSGAVAELEEMQLHGGIAVNQLERLSAMLHGVDGATASRQGSVGYADDLTISLNGHRSERVALLLSVFPVIHWGVLIGLSLSICVAFLLTSNQQALQYLNSIQLRCLFGIIVGVCSGTAGLCWDLSDPFSGTFSVEGAGEQISDLRVCLREDVREALTESGELPSSTRNFFRGILDGPGVSASRGQFSREDRKAGKDENKEEANRYGLLSTLYFHLLTGPLGDNVRAIGDIIAWLTTLVGRKVKAIANWRRWPWRRRENSA